MFIDMSEKYLNIQSIFNYADLRVVRECLYVFDFKNVFLLQT